MHEHIETQQYPPGTQEKYNRFSSRNPITEKGKELEFPEGAGGGKGYRGHEVASTLRREAPLREPEVPPIETVMILKKQLEEIQKAVDNTQIKNAICELNRFLMLHCSHEKVRDYIDIHPEASVPIEYCTICFSTFT